ncbi:LLM class F420-dependent oxidoreductase [Paractinoplanes deccanensis]|uniref:LLM class F420-dependent oxidoreductase n=1 Tax=Paractinoplanes deccanensis TaxID=113561 RepID=A0ABQ3YBS9_9ACTN|nr:LLM class flavin-dependent oxidoreductase [Actinoplanes deccanensis]GID77427.1 LLM class F420-dependent oxidoreductase [Actinoplanes deccanensis]
MTRPYRVGVQLPEIERHVAWPELAEMARTAERVGFDSLWVGDHLLYDLPEGGVRGPWEAWTSLAGLAAVTERVELGPLVAATPFHAPAMLAKQAATVDAISGGRLIVGLGAGWNRREFDAFGFPYDHRVSRFEEAFTIVRRLLRDGHADFHGTYYDAADCTLDPRPVRPGGPPLWLGSVGPRMLSIGLPHVDAWNVWWSDYGNTPAGFAEVRARVEEAAAAAGRAPGEVEATAAVLLRLPGGTGRQTRTRPVEGSPADIARHLAAMAEAGATHLQLVVDPITVESIEWLGQVLAIG